MNTRFAKSTGCFYPLSENYAAVPADIIEVPQEDFDAAMARNTGDTLDVIDGRVVVVPKAAPTRAELVAEAWHGIKAERDRRTENGGFKVGAYWFHSDAKSRSQQQDNEAMGDSLAPVQWKTLSGDFVTMTPVLAAQIREARMTNDRAIFDAAEAHREAMEASANPSAYDYSTDWPQTYDEATAQAAG